jgi:hypothetical protein
MLVDRVIFGKPKRKPKLKSIRVSAGPLFKMPRIKDECFLGLTDHSRTLAAGADNIGTLDLLDGRLHCICGAAVSAMKNSMGEYVIRTRHSTYKERAQPPRKRDYGKHI